MGNRARKRISVVGKAPVSAKKELPRDNLPFPEAPPPKERPEKPRQKAPINAHLQQLAVTMRSKFSTDLGSDITAVRNFILEEVLPLIALNNGAAEATEVIETLIEGEANVEDIRTPLEEALTQAVALKAIRHVTEAMSLDEREQKMLYYIHLCRATGSKGSPSENVLLELFKNTFMPQPK